MLPKMLYEILPFLYLSLGVGSGVAVNSIIVFITSVLLMATGILVLSMRVTYRHVHRSNPRLRLLVQVL